MLHRPKPRAFFFVRGENVKSMVSRVYSTATATAASNQDSPPPIARYPPTQPPSYKQPFLRKSQLHRQYTSLVKSSPMLLLFQHNNLRANEWAGIRRELTLALEKASAASEHPNSMGSQQIKLQAIQTGIFAAALRVVDFYKPSNSPATLHTDSSPEQFTHLLSRNAYLATRRGQSSSRQAHSKPSNWKKESPLHTLLHGPIAVLAFPAVTPSLLAATIRILAPTPGSSSAFPAPRRRDAPGYYENAVQSGLQKLVLLGARIEGRTMDGEGIKWVGGMESGIDGLRAQLVNVLDRMGLGLTTTLEGASRNLWLTMEGRRSMLDDGSTHAATK